jgi:hypothetical protein
MWQRIQTVFLVIAILSLIAAIFQPIWLYTDAMGKDYELFAFHFSIIEKGVRTTVYFPYSITAILAIGAITVAITAIRKYKDRIVQLKLGVLNSLLLAFTLGAAVIFFSSMNKHNPGGRDGLGLWLPAVAVVCNWLAMRFIKRDEKIVRDSQRLR